MRAALALLLTVFAMGATFAGCGESGFGSPCTAGNPDQPGNLRVALGTGQCTSTVCVSYLGSSGYCSQECGEGFPGCPGSALCCPVVQTGAQTPCSATSPCTSSRLTCRQGVCRPRQFCVQATSTCQ
jgi:hypothetical protein